MPKAIVLTLWVAIWLLPHNAALAEQVRVLASNNVYADIARQIGGAAVTVSIADSRGAETSMVRPNSIILCGWAQADAALRDAARRASPSATLIEPPRHASEEAASVAVPWYDAEPMFALAHAYADRLMRIRPDLALQFAGNLAHMRMGFDAIAHRIGEIARDYANSEVVAADPLSRRVANRLGFKAAGPAAADGSRGALSAESFSVLKKALETREGSIFLYDSDVANPELKKLVSLARQNGVPPVGLQDKLPSGLPYQQWVLRQWNTVHGALNEASP
ncbi:MAG TPA: zinc ABC transporter substrate-binding protein [Xanthobacteraceae bacterium]|nr:zinc ABC transporter substrate-binding protein [Xanthobacteraceae bacterium]